VFLQAWLEEAHHTPARAYGIHTESNRNGAGIGGHLGGRGQANALRLDARRRVQIQANGDGVRVRRLLGLNDHIAFSRLRRKPPARHEKRLSLLVFEHGPRGAFEPVDCVARHLFHRLANRSLRDGTAT